MADLLTTVTNAEAWLGLTPGADPSADALVSRLIAAASQQVLGWLQRPTLLMSATSEIRDGTGTRTMVLRRWPVLAVSSLSIDNVAIPAGTYSGLAGSTEDGYFFAAWDGVPPGRMTALEINGYRFREGRQNVAVSYTAGYGIIGEAQTVADVGGVYQALVSAPYGGWAADGGVTYANGTALSRVSGTPAAAGQYALGAAPGLYLFNAAYNGAAVLISYSFTPSAVEHACIEAVADAYIRQSVLMGLGTVKEYRAGGTSITLQAPVTGGPDLLISTPITELLRPYRRVAPV